MKKNTKLFIILLALIVVSAIIALTDGSSQKDDFESDIFQVKDTATLVSVEISNKTQTNLLEKKNGNWELNNQFSVDENLSKILTTILTQIQVKRSVARLNNDEVLNTLKENGNQVRLSFSDGSELAFISGGNNAKTSSYYADTESGSVYIVEIPGYNNYVSGIFELTENQWRDRVLFSTSWRTLKALKIDYDNDEDLQIEFVDRFLKVKGVNEMDTTSLLEYLSQYEYFQINDYLEAGNYPRYDSLSSTNPIANLFISDIDNTKNRQLRVFEKIDGERFYLLTDMANQMMVVDQKRMETLLVSTKKFKSQ